MTANLISVSQAMDNGVDKMVFTKDKVKIIKNQLVIATGTRRGKYTAWTIRTRISAI